MRVLLLDNYDSFTYNLAHYLMQSAHVAVEVARNDQITVDDAVKFEAIVLSPGPGLPQKAGIMPGLLKALESRPVPVLGVCLGLQAMAEHCGGTLINLPKVWHGLPSTLKILRPNDPLFRDIPLVKRVEAAPHLFSSPVQGQVPGFDQEFWMVGGRYHSWAIHQNQLPQNLEPLAVDEDGYIMALKANELPWYGVQFHPESIMTPHGLTLMTNWVRLARKKGEG